MLPAVLEDVGVHMYDSPFLQELRKQKYTQLPPKKIRDEVARDLFEWATERGCVNFAHWASPLRSGANNLLKYDSFVELDFGAKVAHKPIKTGFSGARLFMNETDGSSFPNGGLRGTHRAAAYMAWDTQSNPFIRGDTLYLPSAFVSFSGEALDEKTPLLRSMRAVLLAGKRLLKHTKAASPHEIEAGVDCNVGWEQEFFLIAAEDYERRPDLVASGRTVMGAQPPKGQQTNAHYFAPMNAPAKRIMEEIQAELLALGIPFCVYHQEVAPAQHEFCPIFRVTNVAADHNVMAMEVMKEVCRRHGYIALTHEKPFKAINGSGKHLNWGLNAGSSGRNLMVPGDTPAQQESFMAFVACLTRAVNLHGDLIRAGVASPGNDHRLGAHEAPPAIMSLYIGDGMMAHVEKIIAGGKLEGYGKEHRLLEFGLGLDSVFPISAATEDRNRTAPFPFCGNRFELRACGSNGNISLPLTFVQAAMADSMNYLADLIENDKLSLREAVAMVFRDNQRAIFNGNGYSPEWHKEAEHVRGLPNIRQSVDAYGVMMSEKSQALLKRVHVLNENETKARVQIAYENHAHTIRIEVQAMLDMINQGVLPAAAQDLSLYAALPVLAGERASVYADLAKKTAELQKAMDEVPDEADAFTVAKYTQDVLRTKMTETRVFADLAERLICKELYPFPSYHEMLYKPNEKA